MIKSANVIILSPDGKLILQERDDKPGIANPGQISTFGGKCEAGETPIQTAIREMQEELGLSLTADDLEFWKVYKKTAKKHGQDVTVHFFVLKQRLKPEALTINEGKGYHAVSSHDDLKGLNLTIATGDIIDDYFRNRNAAVKAVIFDVGGVLHQDNSRYVQEALCGSLNIDNLKLRTLWKDVTSQLGMGLIDEKAFWKLAAEKHSIRAVDAEENLFGKPYEQSIKPNEKVLQLVKKLSGKGVRCAVLSNTIKPHGDAMRGVGLFNDFDQVLLSYEVGARKPDPRIFDIALKRLGLDAQEVLFVDDLQENIDAAQALGIRTVLAVDEDQIIEDVHEALG